MKVYNPETDKFEDVEYEVADEKPKQVIQIELDNLHVMPEPKRVQGNGMVYLANVLAGRRVKAVIFEEE